MYFGEQQFCQVESPVQYCIPPEQDGNFNRITGLPDPIERKATLPDSNKLEQAPKVEATPPAHPVVPLALGYSSLHEIR